MTEWNFLHRKAIYFSNSLNIYTYIEISIPSQTKIADNQNQAKYQAVYRLPIFLLHTLISIRKYAKIIHPSYHENKPLSDRLQNLQSF